MSLYDDFQSEIIAQTDIIFYLQKQFEKEYRATAHIDSNYLLVNVFNTLSILLIPHQDKLCFMFFFRGFRARTQVLRYNYGAFIKRFGGGASGGQQNYPTALSLLR